MAVAVDPGPDTGLNDRLRAHDPDSVHSFLHSWAGAVHAYCNVVCETGLVLQATAIAFEDFLQKVGNNTIDDAHLQSALVRSTRLAAAEAAMIDWTEAGVDQTGEGGFRCDLTPLMLAGSLRVPARVEDVERMREHVSACIRCQAVEARFEEAQVAFLAAQEGETPEGVVEAVTQRLAITGEPSEAGGDLVQQAERQAELIRRDALREADQIRREAITAADRLMSRLQALEFPLGELVADLRDEVQGVVAEIESSDAAAATTPHDRQAEHRPGRLGSPASPGDSDERQRAADNGYQAPDPSPVLSPDEGKRGSFLRLRRTKRPEGSFITVEGSCAICRRTFIAGSEDEFAHSGWRAVGDVGLCPDCQADGWQLPDGARLPFRRRV